MLILIGKVNITSIGPQSKSRNKMWVLNHLIWLALIGSRGCEFISLDSIGMALWSPDQKGESYGLITWWSRSRPIPRWNTSEVVLKWEYDGLHMVPLPGSCGWDRRVIKKMTHFLPTTPSSTFLETWSRGKLRRMHHKRIWGVGFAWSARSPRFWLFRRGSFQQIFRNTWDESSNSADGSPQLLKAFSSYCRWW